MSPSLNDSALHFCTFLSLCLCVSVLSESFAHQVARCSAFLKALMYKSSTRSATATLFGVCETLAVEHGQTCDNVFQVCGLPQRLQRFAACWKQS